MPSASEKRREIVARRITVACPKAVALAQMLQGNGLVFEDGKLKYTSGITPEIRSLLSLQFSTTKVQCSEFALQSSVMLFAILKFQVTLDFG
jgi:hypothetical protein